MGCSLISCIVTVAASNPFITSHLENNSTIYGCLFLELIARIYLTSYFQLARSI